MTEVERAGLLPPGGVTRKGPGAPPPARRSTDCTVEGATMAKRKSKRAKQHRTEYMSIPEAVGFLDRVASAHAPDTRAEVNLALLARAATRVLNEHGHNVGDPVRQVAKWLAVGSRLGGGHGRP